MESGESSTDYSSEGSDDDVEDDDGEEDGNENGNGAPRKRSRKGRGQPTASSKQDRREFSTFLSFFSFLLFMENFFVGSEAATSTISNHPDLHP